MKPTKCVRTCDDREERLQRRQDALDRRMEEVEKPRPQSPETPAEPRQASKQPGKPGGAKQQELERISAMTADDAKQLLIESVRNDTRQDMAASSARWRPKHTPKPTGARKIVHSGHPAPGLGSGG